MVLSDWWKYIQIINGQRNFDRNMPMFDVRTVPADGPVSLGARPSLGSVRIKFDFPLRWRHNGRDTVLNHQPHHCLLNRLFRCRSKKTSKLSVTDLCVGNSPGTAEFPTQMASNAENVSIWLRHHAICTGQTFQELTYWTLVDVAVITNV